MDLAALRSWKGYLSMISKQDTETWYVGTITGRYRKFFGGVNCKKMGF